MCSAIFLDFSSSYWVSFPKELTQRMFDSGFISNDYFYEVDFSLMIICSFEISFREINQHITLLCVIMTMRNTDAVVFFLKSFSS